MARKFVAKGRIYVQTGERKVVRKGAIFVENEAGAAATLLNERISAMHFQKHYEPIAMGDS